MLCETVLMHLSRDAIPVAVEALLRIIAPGGTLYLSWRVVETDQRDERGRLYTAFDVSTIVDALSRATVLHSAEAISASSRKRIHTVVARSVAGGRHRRT